MQHLTKLLAVAAAACACSWGAAQDVVTEELLSPAGQGFSYTPSPGPADLATIGPSGSRVAVYRNGEPGPKFDEILNTGGTQEGGLGLQLVFSPDGKRLAYAGRTRGEYVVVVDGEEVARGPYDGRQNIIMGLGFTPDSQHYFYRALVTDESGKQSGRFVMDGVASPDVHPGMQIVISPVGSDYAMFARMPGAGEQLFIRNGEVRDEMPNRIMYRHDGKLYTLEQNLEAQHIVFKLEGETLFEGEANPVEFILPDKGERWAMLCSSGTGASVNAILDGERFEEHITNAPAHGTQRFLFSPDGQRWAAIVEPGPKRQYVLLDGEPQDEYQQIKALTFSPDGSKLTYWGESPTGAYFVNNGEEMDGASTSSPPAIYSSDGAHVSWMTIQTRTGERHLFLNGTKHPCSHQMHHHTMKFSPDGTRIGFIDDVTVHEFTGDGVKKYENLRVAASAGAARGPHKLWPEGFTYSPDSSYIAFFGTNMKASKSGLFINGQLVHEVPPGFGWTRLGFSPDSKHVYYVFSSGEGRALFLDGKKIMEYPYTPLEDDPNMWHIDEAGVLRFVSMDNEGIKRYTVTPSAETSIDDLVSGG